jgi:DNA replication protein DnaC
MLTEEHFEALAKRLKIKTFSDKLHEMCVDSKAYVDMTFEERMVILIEAEIEHRNNTYVNKMNKAARFANPKACLEDIIYLSDRSLDKDYLVRLADGDYINEHDHIVVICESGLGKSFIVQALGNAACRQMRSVRYVRHADLCAELNVARTVAPEAYYGAMRKFEDVELLVLDDFFTTPVSEQNIIDTFEIIEARVDRGSMVIASIIEPEEWHLRIPTKTMADSLLDRITHRSRYIDIKGPNMRGYLAEQKRNKGKGSKKKVAQ